MRAYDPTLVTDLDLEFINENIDQQILEALQVYKLHAETLGAKVVIFLCPANLKMEFEAIYDFTHSNGGCSGRVHYRMLVRLAHLLMGL